MRTDYTEGVLEARAGVKNIRSFLQTEPEVVLSQEKQDNQGRLEQGVWRALAPLFSRNNVRSIGMARLSHPTCIIFSLGTMGAKTPLSQGGVLPDMGGSRSHP